MPLHRLVLLFVLLTLLGLVAVYLQIERVKLGYRVSQEEARLARLREVVRSVEVLVNRKRDLAALQERAESFGAALSIPAAGRVVRVASREILAARPADVPGRPSPASR